MATPKKTGGKRAIVTKSPDQFATKLIFVFVALSFIFAVMAYVYYGQ